MIKIQNHKQSQLQKLKLCGFALFRGLHEKSLFWSLNIGIWNLFVIWVL